jgi:DNA helicase-2/ATP-dependent DNA helicase PcrA
MEDLTLTALIKNIIRKTKYEDYLKTVFDKYETADERIENLHELLTVAQKYKERGRAAIESFLQDVALLQETDSFRYRRLDTNKNCVTLMTMHSSKGLEFPIVFILGMEEGLFPHNMSLLDQKELEEERRLCYVAVTRAKERLFLTFAKFRRIFGSAQANLPSRFIGEIPQHLLSFQWSDFKDDEDVIDY